MFRVLVFKRDEQTTEDRYEGAWYHVMNRGRRSDRIFEARKDYLLFIELMKDATELWDVRIGAYCLMWKGEGVRKGSSLLLTLADGDGKLLHSPAQCPILQHPFFHSFNRTAYRAVSVYLKLFADFLQRIPS